MAQARVGLKCWPTPPRGLDLKLVRHKAIELLSRARLPTPQALAVTGSRVWGLESEDSDIDVLAYGQYDSVVDVLGDFEGIELEVTTVPIDRIRARSLPFEMRWDIVTAVPLAIIDDFVTNAAARDSLLTLGEANCVLSHVIYRLSWLGVSPLPFELAGAKVYSYLDRYKKLSRANTFSLLAYSLHLLSIAQYVINRLPYPFAKWRIAHLNKLHIVSPRLLEFAESFTEEKLSLGYLLELVSKAFLETVELAIKSGYLENGLENEEACREKISFYPYL